MSARQKKQSADNVAAGTDVGRSVQELYWPSGRCFVCGPRDEHCLGLRCFRREGSIVADWEPQPHHAGWPGILHGGAIAALFDCLTGWAAWLAFMEASGTFVFAVTAELTVRYLNPVGLSSPVHLEASVRHLTPSRAVVDGALDSAGIRSATCLATVVSRSQGDAATPINPHELITGGTHGE